MCVRQMWRRVEVKKDDLVSSVALLRQRHWLKRLDTGPFFLLYVVTLVLMISSLRNSHRQQWGLMMVYALILVVHGLVFLFAQFNLELKCLIGYLQAAGIAEATHVLVYPAENSGSPLVSPLSHFLSIQGSFQLLGQVISVPTASFEFQKVCFHFSPEGSFSRLAYPCSGLSIKKLSTSVGYNSEKTLSMATQIWGRNEFNIPTPDFLEVYLDHLVAPFFLFQVLCLFLWSLDDYWMYSLLTLFLLLVFEGVLAQQRLMSLQMLRSMRKDPYFLFVYRLGRWDLRLSDELVPGDIASLTADSLTVQRKKQSKIERYVPCDAVIIRGSCVVNEAMLTGESVPQVKDSIRGAFGEEADVMDLGDESDPHPLWRRYMVFGGSTLSQCSETSPDEEYLTKGEKIPFPIPLAPDAGCLVMIVRTGYGTIQGGLMRKILYATERVTVNSREIFLFIGVLLFFAVISSAVVLYLSLLDPHRNRFKVVLHCVMIVTSVVPPELPMELSLAVTNSLSSLAKELVFCTEPYRIPFAGRVNMICFDKTGTLTQDRMILRGASNPQQIKQLESVSSIDQIDPSILAELEDVSSAGTLQDVEDCGSGLLLAMAACQSLIHSGNGAVVGDPLEVESFQQSGFKVVSPLSDKLPAFSPMASNLKCAERGISARVVHRYPFSSGLKRMSVLVNATLRKETSSFVFCKGAPEVLQTLLSVVPLDYEATFLRHMKSGRRVIALTYRLLASQASASLSRTEAESGLNFLGFLVFNSALKPTTKSVIKELKAANLPLVIVTGDNVYTAADVARKLAIVKKETPLLLLEETPPLASPIAPKAMETSVGSVHWRMELMSEGVDTAEISSFSPFVVSEIAELSREHALCVSGQVLSLLEASSVSPEAFVAVLRKLCPHVKIFSRVNPLQKETITKALNLEGLHTLFCGDGTNDCGALKAAHVGISIINNPEFERKVQESYLQSNQTSAERRSQRGLRATLELHHQREDPTIVKLGDASIASPFTARRTSIECVTTVLRLGRCTLVTTIQVYKVLALNCLVSAYMMSSLYLQGLKHGDMQMTITGMATAGLFYLISTAKPLPTLSELKPPESVFNLSVMLSIFGQFAVHLACLLLVLYLCHGHFGMAPPVLDVDYPLADSQFRPSLVNSAVYLLYTTFQVNNFFVNFRGPPFTENIWSSKLLYCSFLLVYVFVFLLVSAAVEPLNDSLQLVPFPSFHFKSLLALVLLGDLALTSLVEKMCQQLER